MRDLIPWAVFMGVVYCAVRYGLHLALVGVLG